MAQQDETPDVDVEEFISGVEFAEEEIADLRKKENQRHERKMNEIEEKEERYRDEMFEKSGLDVVEAKHEELAELGKEIKSLQSEIRSRVLAVISAHLSGGYNKQITVKRGGVYRYGKKKNARIDFSALARGSYRSYLEDALDKDAPEEVATRVKHALDLIESRECLSLPLFKETRDWIDVTHTYSRYSTSSGKERTFDTLTVRYRTQRPRHGSQYRIAIEDTEGERLSNPELSASPTTRTPSKMKWLVKVRDDVLDLMSEIEGRMNRTLEDYQTVYERIDADLPDPEE